MTIDTKDDAYRSIEFLTDKLRQKSVSFGTHTGHGYQIKHDIATAWDGVDPAPEALADLAEHLDSTPLGAQQYILDKGTEMVELFTFSDRLKYQAKKEISQLPDDPTPKEVQVVYEKHLVIFEKAMS